VAGIDNAIAVTWELSDSFDILPGDKCAVRSVHSGMSDGARVQFVGETVGGSVSTTATTPFERRPPWTEMYQGKPVLIDDGLYCVVRAVFAPAIPDPTSNDKWKFVGGDWSSDLNVGRAPFGKPERPGYGSGRAAISITTCRNLSDPPTKDGPEMGELTTYDRAPPRRQPRFKVSVPQQVQTTLGVHRVQRCTA
jgi:hypothetical protein